MSSSAGRLSAIFFWSATVQFACHAVRQCVRTLPMEQGWKALSSSADRLVFSSVLKKSSCWWDFSIGAVGLIVHVSSSVMWILIRPSPLLLPWWLQERGPHCVSTEVWWVLGFLCSVFLIVVDTPCLLVCRCISRLFHPFLSCRGFLPEVSVNKHYDWFHTILKWYELYHVTFRI